MTAEQILEHEADNFCKYMRDYFREVDGHESFKSDVQSKLYNYYENVDKLIFLYRLHKNISNSYDKHLLKCKYKDEPTKCPENVFYNKALYFLEQEIKELNPSFDYSILRPNINSDLTKKNLIQLKDFPDSGRLFQSALDKLNEGKHERNLIDDLRLSLECLLKQKFNNDKSLENQLENLGTYLKERNTSKEISNMFVKLIDYYSKYQNSNIKHNDSVKSDELDLLVNLTSTFINFIINK
ncbi:MAG TPA: hypothetical protein PKJ83_10240 [Cyclobacteriaceae bacterium]|nr:hypothetical protein [Cyclobacteriaceae bacterium]